MTTPVSCPEFTPNLATKTSLGSLSQSATGIVTTTPHDAYGDREEPSSIREGYEHINSPTPTETSNVSYSYTPSPLPGDHKANGASTKGRSTQSSKLPPVSPAISSKYSNSISSHIQRGGSQQRVRLDISGQFPYFEEEDGTANAHPSHKDHKQEEKQLEVVADDQAQPQSQPQAAADVDTEKNKVEATLRAHGLESGAFIAKTLQGSVFRGRRLSDQKSVVIKRTSKRLHALGITITKTGKRIKVQENIVAEAAMLQRFSANSPPSSLIEYVAFFEDDTDFFLVMAHDGCDFFDFIVRQNEHIVSGALSLFEWRKHCKLIFAQMVQLARWTQNVMRCDKHGYLAGELADFGGGALRRRDAHAAQVLHHVHRLRADRVLRGKRRGRQVALHQVRGQDALQGAAGVRQEGGVHDGRVP